MNNMDDYLKSVEDTLRGGSAADLTQATPAGPATGQAGEYDTFASKAAEATEPQTQRTFRRLAQVLSGQNVPDEKDQGD